MVFLKILCTNRTFLETCCYPGPVDVGGTPQSTKWISELRGFNMWGGQSTITLPEIILEQLNPVTPDPIHYIFEGVIYDW